MSKIVLSCGHEVDDFDHAHYVLTQSTDQKGDKAICCQMVCGPCEDSYRQHGELFDSEDAADAWLKKELW